MSRYTKKSLEIDLAILNKEFKAKGLSYSFKYQSRNGYHAVDLYQDDKCLLCVDCNEPPYKLFDKAQDEFYYLIGE